MEEGVSYGNSSPTANRTIALTDIVLFAGLETLGVLAIIGNLSLIVVLLRNKYLNRASFILMLSLAIADVSHGIVTSCFFYPPIVLNHVHVPEFGIRLFNIIDWTAWAITLTHMSAICLDRLVAIMLYGKYNTLVTIPRIRRFCIFCWTFFFTTNTFFFFFNLCCLTRPLEDHFFYTFGYAVEEKPRLNVYTLSYTPLEIVAICILSVSNPITLVQLYRRHKRKVALRMQGSAKGGGVASLLVEQRSQWQRFRSSFRSARDKPASTMLLEMSMKMGSRQVTHDMRDVAARRANRQQQRILVQISVVALIFYAYMTAYYISYYVTFLTTTATMIFNSFFYSTTHMINPVIYFSLNKEMREQFKESARAFGRFLTCQPQRNSLPSRSNTHREHTVDRVQPSCATYTETVPFLSSNNNYKVTGTTSTVILEEDGNISSTVQLLETKDDLTLMDGSNHDDEEDEDNEDTQEYDLDWADSVPTNKMLEKERSEFMSGIIRALKNGDDNSFDESLQKTTKDTQIMRKRVLKASNSLDGNSAGVNGRFIRISNTLQVISKIPRSESEAVGLFPSTSTFESCSKPNGLGDKQTNSTKMISSSSRISSSSSSSSSLSTTSYKPIEHKITSRLSLIGNPFDEESFSEDDEISYL